LLDAGGQNTSGSASSPTSTIFSFSKTRSYGTYITSTILTDFGGHQNAQFADAISTIKTDGVKAVKVAILDGVLYIKGNNKMYKSITTTYKDYNIMSALVLREFLYSL
jgi:hypothetical protein